MKPTLSTIALVAIAAATAAGPATAAQTLIGHTRSMVQGEVLCRGSFGYHVALYIMGYFHDHQCDMRVDAYYPRQIIQEKSIAGAGITSQADCLRAAGDFWDEVMALSPQEVLAATEEIFCTDE